ncbi:hypothetical protein [Lunatimonas sp.]|nr:hypothetical protein [Lunatimonas sp.]
MQHFLKRLSLLFFTLFAALSQAQQVPGPRLIVRGDDMGSSARPTWPA